MAGLSVSFSQPTDCPAHYLALESASFKSWPALQQIDYEGWIVRLGDGYTKRANSVTALAGSSGDLDRRIAHCEALYRKRGLRPIFRLTPYSRPSHLDGVLASQGYTLLDPSLVMSLDLDQWQSGDERSVLPPIARESWIERFHALDGRRSVQVESHRRLIERIASPCLLASLPDDRGRLVGCGLGVLEDGYFGLYDLVVDPALRNQGHGRRLLNAMLAWAKARGVHHAYLQVTAENAAAQHVYGALGFVEAYPYWYRVAPSTEH
ncbi:MAG: GNAT family N-acetyltransferase [Anaerolineae bacterium]|nr:GNAT family N-acetyltransferase [Anaerolineae bacterium]